MTIKELISTPELTVSNTRKLAITSAISLAMLSSIAYADGISIQLPPVISPPIQLTTPPASPAPFFRFSPQVLDVSYYDSEMDKSYINVNLQGEILKTLPKGATVVIEDKKGVFTADLSLRTIDNTHFKAGLKLRSIDLKFGIHEGYLTVKVCPDSSCNNQYYGSPIYLPYRINKRSIYLEDTKPLATASTKSINLVVDQGKFTSVDLKVIQTRFVQRTSPEFFVVDDKNIISSGMHLYPTLEQGRRIKPFVLPVRGDLKPGVYKGNLTVQVFPYRPYKGLPLTIPYTITVRKNRNITPLAKATELTEWQKNRNGNDARTGYVPITLDYHKFNTRWRWKLPDAYGAVSWVSPYTIANDTIFFVVNGSIRPSLNTLKEYDASKIYRKFLDGLDPSGYTLTAPVADNQRVYLSAVDATRSALFGIRQTTGASDFITPFPRYFYPNYSYWTEQHTFPPLLHNNSYYEECGFYTCSVDTSTGKINWKTQVNNRLTNGGNNIYALIFGTLTKIDNANGAILGNYNFDRNASRAIEAYPIYINPNNIIVRWTVSKLSDIDQHIASIDMENRKINWITSGAFYTNPVTANNVVYFVRNKILEARDVNTGTILWRKTVPADPNAMLVTDNLFFLADGMKTYAIDLQSRNIVWTYNYGAGQLSISDNAILYLGAGRELHAINLR